MLHDTLKYTGAFLMAVTIYFPIFVIMYVSGKIFIESWKNKAQEADRLLTAVLLILVCLFAIGLLLMSSSYLFL